ncbi:MBL fold metallo-hydrolase [Bacillus wiedmannii]|uniref:ComEC/Rec2 family competence protein n=1 Tax=Bacillus wiedmannii TaxID=1890302 RepID=UPI00019FDB2C|nr:MBL fold metallo-hydrolase [Bacillus wiedmannii]EEK68219.1 Beta-lactamase domain protein [Bacillus wiedmannii]MCC2379092.1 MBL fold metallo-hydrolase [Bacillus wiedmannii]MCC2423720.1 MBL fold metallo-hydrolase [Bacillus wiedmannii]
MVVQLKVFPANKGDAILISHNSEEGNQNILVDGGTGREIYRILKEEFKRIKSEDEFIDLLVVTHCDDDHIKGIIDIFQDTNVDKTIIKEVWFNSGGLIAERLEEKIEGNRDIPLTLNNSKEKSITQGITLETELEKLNCWSKTLVRGLLESKVGDMKLTVLSPNEEGLRKLNKKWEREIDSNKQQSGIKTDYEISMVDLLTNKFEEDKRVPNGSSIAFLLEIEEHKILMLGDSHPSVIEESLLGLGYSSQNKLKVDVVKVSHHGSKHNTSESLLSIIDCQNYIVSTDGKNHGHPNKECFSRIVCTRQNQQEYTNFYFNYNLKNIFMKKDYDDFKINSHYLSENGYIYELGE